ncbi:MAG: 50S ribosomal protein L21 [Magnetococcales bacterium]|nr:50S ribosomal protein L21 [Magnetococcales bacterium]
MYAVVRTGGKQYRVAVNDCVRVEQLPGEKGDTVELRDVLMVANDATADGAAAIQTGSAVAQRVVTAQIVQQLRDRKIIVFKKRRRVNYRRKQGHRQNLTELRITAIQ